MYKYKVPMNTEMLAHVKEGSVQGCTDTDSTCRRLILKGGRIVDPKNNRDEVAELVIQGRRVLEVVPDAQTETGDRAIDCTGLLVFPGLIDMHLHLGDLFEVSTDPINCAAQDGVTFGLSPGAGNTFMAPALLGAEVDRGVPINLGVYLGAAAVLGTRMNTEELIQMFRGELSDDIMSEKMTRNSFTNTTAALTIGIKDHMGHFIMPDESIDKIFEITTKAGLVYMSHTQDPAHAERMVSLAKGRALHLGHATAAACGTHDDPKSGFRRVLDLINGENVTGEFVTTMLRPERGCREGLRMTKQTQQMALDALEQRKVKILVSDGQNQATMKGFGDTRDNVPTILEIAEHGVLPLKDAVALMTANPAEFLATRTGNPWWREATGNLGVGALANITVVSSNSKRPVYTIVNGEITAFEKRIVRRGMGAGYWVCSKGVVTRTGVGDVSMFARVK